MVETYGLDENRFYYIAEATAGVTPTVTPAMLSVPCTKIDPGFNPSNILLRGAGSYDLQSIKKGLFKPELKIDYIVPSEAPINLLQYVKTDLDKTLSAQVLFHKGTWVSATDIISLLYNYLRIGTASVSCDIDDVVKASMNLIGQNLTTGTAKLSGATYGDYSGAIGFDETYVKIDTVANERIAGWRFDINTNPKRIPVIRSTNGHLAKYVSFGKRELGGEITFEFESKTEMDAALADTEFDLEFGLYGTNKATFSDCKWTDISHQQWLEDLICVKAQFDCKGPLAIAAS